MQLRDLSLHPHRERGCKISRELRKGVKKVEVTQAMIDEAETDARRNPDSLLRRLRRNL